MVYIGGDESLNNMENILEKFGLKVREERLKAGLSQEELADKAGLHRTYVGMIERAEKNVTLRNIAKIAKALDVELIALFDFKKP